MRKLIILMVTLALGGAVPFMPRAIAQTAPPSKDGTTTLNAQTKRNVPARNVSQVRRPTQNISRVKTPTRSVSRPTGMSRTVSRPNTSRTVGVSRTGGNRVVTQRSSGRTGKIGMTQRSPQGKTGLTQRGPQGKTGLTQRGPQGKTGLTQRGPQGKIGLQQGPGTTMGKLGSRTGKIGMTRGPGKVGVVARRPLNVFRGPRRLFVNDRWRTLVPLAALGVIMVGAETFYADGYVPLAGPVCTGITEDGCQLRWQAVPTEDGGSEYQCVQYCAGPARVITQAPPPVSRETTGVGPANEPAAVATPPAAPETGCELLIYSEENFKGATSPAAENQASLDQEGWKNEIASIEVKSGTWDFYTDESYGGEMMRLGVGTYGKLDPKWSKHIGSFMCTSPGK